MKELTVNLKAISRFKNYLIDLERSRPTVDKYVRDVIHLANFANKRTVNRALLLEYKQSLIKSYAPASVNSMLASVNCFLRFSGSSDMTLRQVKIQKAVYCSEDKELSKEEYIRLVRAAQKRNDRRLALILQTVCATGIRIGELAYITVASANRGEATVLGKGKTRTVFIPRELSKKLLRYAKERGVHSGSVFVTRSGKPIDRSNVWTQMKALCREANVSADKVFPHNLRHLFARTFYKAEKDISRLADILGHSSVNTTRIYMISSGAEHRRKVENMRLII